MQERKPDFLEQAFQRWREAVTGGEGHPDEEMLAGFLAGNLTPGEEKALKAHLAACRDCNLLITVAIKAGSAEGELEPPEELLEKARNVFDSLPESGPLEIILKLKDYMLELVSTTGDVLVGQELVPAPVLRSRQIKEFKDQIVVFKDFKDLRVELKLVTRGEQAASIYISAKDKPSLEAAKGLRISLVRDNVELESYTSDSGKASFEQVAAGSYTLKLQRLEQSLAIVRLEINQ